MSNVNSAKKESTALYVARIALILLLITAVVAAVLAAVNSITAPRIAQLKEEKIQEAVNQVLFGGGEEISFDKAANPLVSAVYQGESGYAVEVNPAGFGGTVTMMVGIDNEGNVLKIQVVSQTETAGLGAIIAQDTSAGEDFRAQFAGSSGSVAVSKDGGGIDALTGATITSRAVCTGVNAALDCVASLG